MAYGFSLFPGFEYEYHAARAVLRIGSSEGEFQAFLVAPDAQGAADAFGESFGQFEPHSLLTDFGAASELRCLSPYDLNEKVDRKSWNAIAKTPHRHPIQGKG